MKSDTIATTLTCLSFIYYENVTILTGILFIYNEKMLCYLITMKKCISRMMVFVDFIGILQCNFKAKPCDESVSCVVNATFFDLI